MGPRSVAIVPHTHWDREWYEPYQTFRLNLVDMLDKLLPLLESDPSYARFLLDGQMAVVDDYLEVRPHEEGRIRALAASGRLSMGPWYILMDEFLVSGETIIRNLQKGIVRGAAFGGAMDVGYLPDMFGHIAQMPQILRLAGLEYSVVWRGVPSAITKTGFYWEAPDGSRVRTEYLPVGYSNGASLPDDAKALVRRVEDHEQEIGEFLIDTLLIMNGSDHLSPQPWLGPVVADANAQQDRYNFAITSLAEYLAQAPTEGLEEWKGELRSGARANMLMGVTSNRVDVKRAAARAERVIERRAEPYWALFGEPEDWPARELELAWLGLIHNSAHDSICACSVDDVVDAVLERYSESRQIGEGLATRALRCFASSMADPGPVIVNPSPRARGGTIELVVTANEPPANNVQVVSERFGLPGAMTLDANTVRTVLAMLQSPKIDNDAWVQDVSIEEDDTGIDVTLKIGTEEVPNVPIAEMKGDLYTRIGARPDAAIRIRLEQPPIRRIVARTKAVPGFGWLSFAAADLAHRVEVANPTDAPERIQLSNGILDIVVEPDGTFSINETAGFGRLVEGGDLGDSYNFSPPGKDSIVDSPSSVTIAIGDRGPVRGTVLITATYNWPEYVDGGSQARVGERLVEVTTTLELHADEPFVKVTTSFVNPSRDHRLRVHLPLPERASESSAECAFTVVQRGLEAEGRDEEYGLPTFPARRFVAAGGLTVVHDGVVEYELVDIEEASGQKTAGTLALTLLRSTGMLSRLGMAYRPFPAGPLTAVEGLQLVGKRIETTYALAVGPVDPFAMAEDILHPLEAVTSLGGGTRPAAGSALTLEGAQVSAVRRDPGGLEVRVFNPTASQTVVRLPGRSGWLIDLRGVPLEAFENEFALRPFGIATIRLH